MGGYTWILNLRGTSVEHCISTDSSSEGEDADFDYIQEVTDVKFIPKSQRKKGYYSDIVG